MCKHPNPDAETHARTTLRPGAPHEHDISTPGAFRDFVLADARLDSRGFVFGGFAWTSLVLVALAPVSYLVLGTIAVGH